MTLLLRILDALRIFGAVVGLTATIFFMVYFWSIMRGHGVLVVEPNMAIATAEFGMCVAGVAGMTALTWLALTTKPPPAKSKHEWVTLYTFDGPIDFCKTHNQELLCTGKKE